MHISAMEEYGLRCVLQLARLSAGHETRRSTDKAPARPLSASEIAEKEGISVEYVSKFMHLFKKAGLVHATRGVQGGFLLAHAPEQLPLKAVFDALKTKHQSDAAVASNGASFCGQFSGKNETCVHINQCSVRPFWNVFTYYFDEVAKSLTVADLIAQEKEASEKIKSIVDEKVVAVKQAILSP
jgi:Rrf2 family protein